MPWATQTLGNPSLGPWKIVIAQNFTRKSHFLHPGRGDLILVGHLKESDLVTSRNQILSLQGIRFCHFKESDFVKWKESDLVIQGIRFGHSRNQIWSFKESDLVNWKESDFVKKESENVLFSPHAGRACTHAHAMCPSIKHVVQTDSCKRWNSAPYPRVGLWPVLSVSVSMSEVLT